MRIAARMVKVDSPEPGEPRRTQADHCMYLIIGVIALVAIAIVAIRIRRKGTRADARAQEKTVDLLATTSKFHAVSIRPGLIACDAAMAMHGQRFLSDAAPPIPLKGCNQANCQCKFVHHGDRRSGDDRRSPYPSSLSRDTGIFRQEQRQSGDRRQDPPVS